MQNTKIEIPAEAKYNERILYAQAKPHSPCAVCHHLGKTSTGYICGLDMGNLVDMGDCYEQTAVDEEYPGIEEWLRPVSLRIKSLMLLALVTLISEEVNQ